MNTVAHAHNVSSGPEAWDGYIVDDPYARRPSKRYRNQDDMPTEGWSATGGLMPGEDTTMTDISLQDWLTMKEACTYLDCHPRTIGRYVKLGWLHPRASARNANKYLLSRAEIDAIVALAHTPAE